MKLHLHYHHGRLTKMLASDWQRDVLRQHSLHIQRKTGDGNKLLHNLTELQWTRDTELGKQFIQHSFCCVGIKVTYVQRCGCLSRQACHHHVLCQTQELQTLLTQFVGVPAFSKSRSQTQIKTGKRGCRMVKAARHQRLQRLQYPFVCNHNDTKEGWTSSP
ncbi:hypothetical protein KP509_29G022300 [Ceratopteris richardii]|uniref:Uncharacterized protein n=1 Tax=Ceratopteris richardii TaxID=49495 RepID=A0A8T2R7R7_CERRI|nr:hypothetical protein KP509_29G022300 [Ceratopteris richardii]